MARRRHQHPKPFMHRGWWVINYRIDEFKDGQLKRVQKQARLAVYGTRWREVEQLRDEFMAPLNHGTISAGGAVTFKDYVEQVYRRNKLLLLEGSSQDRYDGVLDNYLIPAFGDKMLRELTYDTVQAFFTQLAAEPQKIVIGGKRKDGTVRSEQRILTLESRRKIWTVFSGVMEQARKSKRVQTKPSEDIELGRDTVGRRVKQIVTPQLFIMLLDAIAEPYATMIFVDVLSGGFRVSELVGLKRKNVNAADRIITVAEKFCRGRWGAPKSEKSNASVIVPRCVIQRLLALDEMKVSVKAGWSTRVFDVVKKKGPEDLVFQSVKNGVAMNDSNILRRHIKPAGEKIGIPWVNWLCLRRTASTWHKKAGNNPKDAQAILRHEDEHTTLKHYTLTDYEDQVAAVDRFEQYFLREARPTVN